MFPLRQDLDTGTQHGSLPNIRETLSLRTDAIANRAPVHRIPLGSSTITVLDDEVTSHTIHCRDLLILSPSLTIFHFQLIQNIMT